MSGIYKSLVMASLFNEACALQVTIVPTSPHCPPPSLPATLPSCLFLTINGTILTPCNLPFSSSDVA